MKSVQFVGRKDSLIDIIALIVVLKWMVHRRKEVQASEKVIADYN